MNKFFSVVIDNLKTLFYALIIAILIRSLLFQPFYIPSSSMEPTLLIGDRIFVNKYSYGYSKHSFPFSPPIMSDRIFFTEPKKGDLVVFKTPADNRTDYIKRLVGFPGDKIQFKDGDLFINEQKISKNKSELQTEIRCGERGIETTVYEEQLDTQITHLTAYLNSGSIKNTDVYVVPTGHYFMLGDNRDCSKDSRFLSSVGFIPKENLVGKASIIFFSNDTLKGSMFNILNLHRSFRLERLFKTL